jgi:hypothetical protein
VIRLRILWAKVRLWRAVRWFRTPVVAGGDVAVNVRTGVVVDERYSATDVSPVPEVPFFLRREGMFFLIFAGVLTWVFLQSRARQRGLRRELAAARSATVFAWLEVLFPPRVTREEIGDALELIHRIATDPTCRRPHAMIYAKMVSTVFWVVVNSLRQIISSVLGKKSE